MRVLITGKSGYIAGELKILLTRSGHCAECVSVRGELPDMSGYDAIVHCAAIVHRKERAARDKYFEINTLLTERLGQRAKQAGVKHFIFLSTMAVYGVRSGEINSETPLKPYSLYGKSKLEAEKRLERLSEDSFRVSIVRPPMVYGKGCRGNYNMLRRLALLPIFPEVDNKRSVIYSGNLCRFIFDLLESGNEGVFMPADSETVSTSRLAELIAGANGHRLYLSKLLGQLVKRLNIGVVQKAFGSLYYADNTCSCVKYTAIECAIMLTESKCDEIQG